MAAPPRHFAVAAGVLAGAPCLDGHFPGNPVVPGAMMLALLSARLAGEGVSVARVRRMKFLRVLRPDVPFDIEVTQGPQGASAVFRDAAGVFAEARIELRRADA